MGARNHSQPSGDQGLDQPEVPWVCEGAVCMASLLLVPHQRGYPVPERLPPPSSALCRVETPGQLGLLLPGPVVISQRETGPHTGRHQEVRTRPVLLALDRLPWSSVEDLAVASLPSSSSVTYERNVIGCS